MSYSIPAKMTPRAAAQQVILNQIDLSEKWDDTCVNDVFGALLKLSITDVLGLVDISDTSFLSVGNIPQFGSIETLIRVPAVVKKDISLDGVSYASLGFGLKSDIEASLDANVKFGETHGKGAALLGLVSLKDNHFFPSSFTASFCDLSEGQKHELAYILLFRIPIVQAILRGAGHSTVNGYDFMQGMTVSTKKRRAQCLRAIFKVLGSFNDRQLCHRINNVLWDIEG